MDKKKLTRAEWEKFFDTLFVVVGNMNSLMMVCIPLVKAMEAAGYMDDAANYLYIQHSDDLAF